MKKSLHSFAVSKSTMNKMNERQRNEGGRGEVYIPEEDEEDDSDSDSIDSIREDVSLIGKLRPQQNNVKGSLHQINHDGQ